MPRPRSVFLSCPGCGQSNGLPIRADRIFHTATCTNCARVYRVTPQRMVELLSDPNPAPEPVVTPAPAPKADPALAAGPIRIGLPGHPKAQSGSSRATQIVEAYLQDRTNPGALARTARHFGVSTSRVHSVLGSWLIRELESGGASLTVAPNKAIAALAPGRYRDFVAEVLLNPRPIARIADAWVVSRERIVQSMGIACRRFLAAGLVEVIQ